MCTVALAIRCSESSPLIVAANRDERTDRPSSGPELRPDGSGGSVLSPKDLIRGGSWIGTNSRGLFVAITNRDEVNHVSGSPSRGMLVSDMLSRGRASDITDVVGQVAGRWNNGFHLVAVDSRDAFMAFSTGDELVVRRLNDGVHVLTSYGFDPDHCLRETFVRSSMTNAISSPLAGASFLESEAMLMLANHGDGSARGSTCVHHLNESHKTRSSMIVTVDSAWSNFRIASNDSSPCSGTWDAYRMSVEDPFSSSAAQAALADAFESQTRVAREAHNRLLAR